MGIKLGSEEFNSNNDIKIFNNGVAGIANNSRGVKIEKKSDSDHPLSPDYKLYWADPQGAEINRGIYYFTTGDAKQQAAAVNLMRDLITAYISEDAWKIAPEFPDMKAALDWTIAQITPVFNKVLVRLSVNFGAGKKQTKYLQVRTYHPFIEAESTAEVNSKMHLTDYDFKTRLVADQPVMNSTSAPSSVI